MGFIREAFGRITLEHRSESFIIHPDYGEDIAPPLNDAFVRHWRDTPHPEFLLEDIDSLIDALKEMKREEGLKRCDGCGKTRYGVADRGIVRDSVPLATCVECSHPADETDEGIL
jgi:hypothetical protein